MDPNELVLTFPRKLFDDLGAFDGFSTDHARYLDPIFDPEALKFVPRGSAEQDFTLKQLIPYVVIAWDGKVLFYIRGKGTGDPRLKLKGSVGIGGHINNWDESLFMDRENVLREMYDRAVQREVDEEISLTAVRSKRIVGVINDDSNEVGKVHFGVVHLWEVEDGNVKKAEAAITKMEFLKADEILSRKDVEIESWSRLFLERSGEIALKR